MYGVILIIVLAVMGGIIAYIGDNLGYKLGKRRLSIFGLRPRHTSSIFTIITGILIAAATLGAMSVVSKDVRTALFGMETMKQELAALTGEVAGKNRDLETSQLLLTAKNKELSSLASEIEATATRLKNVSQELSAATAERDRAVTALAQAQAVYSQEITVLQQTKNTLDAKVTTLTDTKDKLQSDIDNLNELTAKLRQGIQVVREGVIILRAGEVLTTFTLQGGDKERALKAIQDGAGQVNQALLTRWEVKDKTLQALWISQQDVEDAVTFLGNTQEEVIIRITSASNVVYGEPVLGQLEIFPNQLIYSAGDKVAERTFEISGGDAQAEENVLLFLQQVNNAAIQQGVIPDPLAGTVGAMSGAQLYETVNKVKRFNGKVELVAHAKGNIYAVGPLKITIAVRSVL